MANCKRSQMVKACCLLENLLRANLILTVNIIVIYILQFITKEIANMNI